MISFLRLNDTTMVESHSTTLAEWILQTGVSFFAALFGDAQVARRNLRMWVCRRSSEFSALSATLAILSDKPVGMLITLPGGEIPERRRADLLALLTNASPERRTALKAHLANFQDATAAVSPDEYYIRTLAVDRGHRGAGIGRRLVDKALGDGEQAGFRRFRLDVETDNAAALGLYQSVGFFPDPKNGRATVRLCHVFDVVRKVRNVRAASFRVKE